MAKTFTEQLGELQKANLGSGFIVAAQAHLLKRQNQATLETLDNYNRAIQEFNEGGVKTRDEQIADLEGTETFKDSVDTIEQMSANYMTNLQAHLERSKILQQIGSGAVNTLMGIGGEDAEKLAGTIDKDVRMKLELQKEQMEAELKGAQFKALQFNIMASKINAEKNSIEVEALKKDIDTMDLISKLQMELNKEWNDLLGKLIMKDGRHLWVDAKNKLFQKAQDIYGDNPNLGNALRVIDKTIDDRIKIYNTPREPQGTGLQRQVDEENYTLQLYNWLTESSRLVADLQYNPRFEDLREAYKRTAENLYGEMTKENSKKFEFGSDIKVIEAMRNSGLYRDQEVLHNGVYYRYDELPLLYNNIMKNDNSEQNYWKTLAEFKKRIGVQSITPLNRVPNPNSTSPLDKEKIQRNAPIVTFPAMGVAIPLDLTNIMSNDEGMWNPYYPDAFETAASMTQRFTEGAIKEQRVRELASPSILQGSRSGFSPIAPGIGVPGRR